MDDDAIVDAMKLLGETEGIFAETAGGVTLAVARKLIEQGRIDRDGSTVICITGNGLKTAGGPARQGRQARRHQAEPGRVRGPGRRSRPASWSPPGPERIGPDRAARQVMARLKRIALGLLVAYAASMTLLRLADVGRGVPLPADPGRRTEADRARISASDPLMRTARDYGADLTPLEHLAVRIADLQGLLMVPSIVLFFLVGLGAGLIPTPSRSNFDKD